MVHLLAYLARQGFRIVISTHSLTILYALNNLLLASALGEQSRPDIPPSEVRLLPDMVAAYLFSEQGEVQSLLDEREGFIDEAVLGEVNASLSDEMNRIMVAAASPKAPEK